jgi:predicted DNA-binding transcriptional regulator AlpA
MTAKKRSPLAATAAPQTLAPLEPNQVVRKKDAFKYFGLKPTAIDEGIANGSIPRPFALSPKARGWFGWQIIEYQQKLIEAAKSSTK